MDPLQFDAFCKQIYIKAPLEQLYDCWATEAGICSWFLRRATYTMASGGQRQEGAYVDAGDRYTWEWHNWDGRESGKVLEANGRDRFVFTFAGPCTVSVSLKPAGEKVLVSLRQYDIPTDEETKMNTYVGCSNGWTFWLANLKAFVEHGILLNETEEDLTGIPNAAHTFVNM